MSKEDQKENTFIWDAEDAGGDMPSVTRLLNRKSLKLGKDKETAALAAPSGPPPSLPPRASIPAAPVSPPAAPPGPPAMAAPPSAPPSFEQAATIEAPGAIELSPSFDSPIETSSPPAFESSGSGEGSGGISLTFDAPEALSIESHSEAAAPAMAEAVPPPSPEPLLSQEPPAFAMPDLAGPATADVPEDDTSTTKIKPSGRKRSVLPELSRWNLAQLRKNADPLAKALVTLFDQGFQSALYLPMQAPEPGQKVPMFTAASMIGSPFKERVWRGLKWDPRVVPQLWNVFLRTGLVELTPPGHNTVATSNRNVVRAAFGISLEEYLILVRVGPLNACRGILALVSIESKVRAVELIMATLEAPIKKAA